MRIHVLTVVVVRCINREMDDMTTVAKTRRIPVLSTGVNCSFRLIPMVPQLGAHMSIDLFC
jgi:hypothetical protein